MLKKYILFGGDVYYPRGGMRDFVDTSDNLNDLIGLAVETYDDDYEWAYVFDTELMKRVWCIEKGMRK